MDELQYAAAIELGRRQREESIRYVKVKSYQMGFLMSDAWIDAVFGGNRSGKTFIGAYKFVCLCLGENGIARYGLPRLKDEYPEPPFTCWVVSVDFTQSREVVQPMVLNMIPAPEIEHVQYREKKAIDFIILKNGVRILFKSCDSGWQRFQGAAIPLLWFDEEPDEKVFKECVIRIGENQMKILVTETPLLGNTWLVDAIYDGMIADTKVFEFSTGDNDSLPHGSVDKLKNLYPEEEWETRFDGKPLSKSGLVYPEFSGLNMYSCDDMGAQFEELDWYFFMDHGGSTPTAILLVATDMNGNIMIDDEHYCAGLTVDEHAMAAQRLYKSVPEEHEFRLSIIDPSTGDGEKKTGRSIRMKWIAAFDHAGIETALVPGNNDVELGIDVVRTLLKPTVGCINPFTMEEPAPRLYINSRCRKTIWEIRRYRWHSLSRSSSMDLDKVRKKDDHAMDATRYGCVYVAGIAGGKKAYRRKHRRKNPITGY